MKINYENKIIPVNDQAYLATVLNKIQCEDNVEKKVYLQEELYKDLKDRYDIPKDHYISLSKDIDIPEKIAIFDFGSKMTRA